MIGSKPHSVTVTHEVYLIFTGSSFGYQSQGYALHLEGVVWHKPVFVLANVFILPQDLQLTAQIIGKSLAKSTLC